MRRQPSDLEHARDRQTGPSWHPVVTRACSLQPPLVMYALAIVRAVVITHKRKPPLLSLTFLWLRLNCDRRPRRAANHHNQDNGHPRGRSFSPFRWIPCRRQNTTDSPNPSAGKVTSRSSLDAHTPRAQGRALSPHRLYNSPVGPMTSRVRRDGPIVLERPVTVPEQRPELAVLDELDQVQHIELRLESDVACASPCHRSS